MQRVIPGKVRSINNRHNSKVAAFLHIEKTGGSTVEALLKRNFGIRHLNVDSRRGPGTPYTKADMAEDLRFYPFVRSIAAHRLWPHVDFGEFEDRLVWYTWFRQPVDRYISHFQHQVEKMSRRTAFAEWLKISRHWNLQVRKLAGEADLEAAKQILATKVRYFGLLERFDESLLLLRHHMQWDSFVVAYGKPRNPARTGAARERIREQFDQYRDDLLANNNLDLALYEYAARTLYPRLVASYGESHLHRDFETAFLRGKRSLREDFREIQSSMLGKLVYKPFLKASGMLRRIRYGRVVSK